MAKAAKKKAPRAIQHSRARDREEKPTPAEEAAETTRLKKVAFLAAYRDCGRVTKAAASVGIDRTTHYLWCHDDPEYKKEFDTARGQVIDMLEDEAIRRAHEGVDRPLIGRVGKDEDGVVTTVKDYSDRLLELLLKGNRPERYRERHEITGANGGPIETHELSDTERAERIARIFDAARARRAGSSTEGADEMGTPPGAADRGGDK